jgi:hypothetical protein
MVVKFSLLGAWLDDLNLPDGGILRPACPALPGVPLPLKVARFSEFAKEEWLKNGERWPGKLIIVKML